jgi:CubicO group peptidase (beta-lactamase class C family)
VNRLINRSLLFAAAVAVCSFWLAFHSHRAVARQAAALMLIEASRGHFSGAVLISRGGRVVFRQAYGLANASWGIANTADTRFRIGSITKTFTAALVMLLAQEGRLSLDDSICRYVTPCPAQWQVIKLRHLLSHTSGIITLPIKPDQLDVPQSRSQMLGLFESTPLAFAVGTRFQYSNSNYYLLGMALETVTGKPYGTVLRDRILSPLQLRDTGLIEPDTVVHELAEGYDIGGGGRVIGVRPLDPSWSYAAGAMSGVRVRAESWLWGSGHSGGPGKQRSQQP